MNYVSNATVKNIINHTKVIKEFVLELDKKRKYNPGQFVQLTLENVTASDIWPDSRTFSIASYNKNSISLIIKNEGGYTKEIFKRLKIGLTCTIKFPFGDLFRKDLLDERHILLAGGVGITPYLGIIDYFKERGKLENLTLFYSVRHKHDILHLKKLEENLGSRLRIFITNEVSGEYYNRRISIEDILGISSFDDHVYISGSKQFNNDFYNKLTTEGYNKIHMDEWE